MAFQFQWTVFVMVVVTMILSSPWINSQALMPQGSSSSISSQSFTTPPPSQVPSNLFIRRDFYSDNGCQGSVKRSTLNPNGRCYSVFNGIGMTYLRTICTRVGGLLQTMSYRDQDCTQYAVAYEPSNGTQCGETDNPTEYSKVYCVLPDSSSSHPQSSYSIISFFPLMILVITVALSFLRYY